VAVEQAAPPKRPAIGIPVYVAGAIALVGLGIFAYLALSPARPAPEIPLSAEGKAYIKNLQLSDVSMKATGSYASQTLVEIEGKIANTGNRPVEVVEIYCVFRDPYGQMIYKPRLPIVSAKMGGLKPNETKTFRLPFDEIPDSWNQALPQLVVAGVKFS
jgi:hypothetical protein